MNLEDSRYVKKPKKPSNTWSEISISEGNMTDLIAVFLQQTSHVRAFSDIERVIVGELANGQYPVSVLKK